MTLLSLAILPSETFAGKLDDFEGDATKKDRDASDKASSTVFESNDSILDDSCVDPCLEAALGAVIEGAYNCGKRSWQEVRRREPGEFLIPFIRFDYAYQDVESDVHASDYRLEVGYGPFGIAARKTHYVEDAPEDELDINQIYLLYRMSLLESIQIDLGIGGFELDGNDSNSSTSFTAPVLLQPFDFLRFELRPHVTSINGNVIWDTDLGVLCGRQYVSLRAGFRWLRTNGQSLDGPYIGLSVRY